MGLQLIGLRDPSHLIIYQYVPHMSYAAIRKFLRGYHNHRMCNSAAIYNLILKTEQPSCTMNHNSNIQEQPQFPAAEGLFDLAAFKPLAATLRLKPY